MVEGVILSEKYTFSDEPEVSLWLRLPFNPDKEKK